jgi:signal transduction histidine kinase
VTEELPPLLIRRMRKAHWIGLDCVGAVVLLLLSAGHAAGQPPLFGVPKWLAVVAAALAALGLAVRRLRPVPVLVGVLVANTFVTTIGASGNPAVAVAVVLYTVAASQPPRRSLSAMAAALVLTVTAEAFSGLAGRPALGWGAFQEIVAVSVAITVAAWTTGAAAREQRRYAARSAEELARRAVADERLRIARELHDVIAHSMALITAKAAVTNYLIDSRPQEARSALRLIESTGRGALTEMRRLLGVLRADGQAPPPPGSPSDGTQIDDVRAPAPGLSGLEALADRATAAGVSTRLDISGERELPEAVALSVYRIAQEAITNVIKHAAPARCHIQVDLAGDRVAIDITDDGHIPPPTPGGHGLIGMRERVTLYGGHFAAGPRPEGRGYRVTASIPLGPAEPVKLPAPAEAHGRPKQDGESRGAG